MGYRAAPRDSMSRHFVEVETKETSKFATLGDLLKSKGILLNPEPASEEEPETEPPTPPKDP